MLNRHCSVNQVKATALKKSHVVLRCGLDTDAEAADSAQRKKKNLYWGKQGWGKQGKKTQNSPTGRKTQVNSKTKLRRGGGSTTVDGFTRG